MEGFLEGTFTVRGEREGRQKKGKGREGRREGETVGNGNINQ